MCRHCWEPWTACYRQQASRPKGSLCGMTVGLRVLLLSLWAGGRPAFSSLARQYPGDSMGFSVKDMSVRDVHYGNEPHQWTSCSGDDPEPSGPYQCWFCPVLDWHITPIACRFAELEGGPKFLKHGVAAIVAQGSGKPVCVEDFSDRPALGGQSGERETVNCLINRQPGRHVCPETPATCPLLLSIGERTVSEVFASIAHFAIIVAAEWEVLGGACYLTRGLHSSPGQNS